MAVSIAREFDQSQPEFLEHEFEIYRELREHLPVARAERRAANGGAAAGWVLTRYHDITEVLTNPADFSNQITNYPVRPWIPQAVDPPAVRAPRTWLLSVGWRRLGLLDPAEVPG